MKIQKITEYIENESLTLKDLEEELSQLKLKWFKTKTIMIQIEFLKYYIKEKERLINKLKLNKEELIK